MNASRRARRAGDPLATLTLFKDDEQGSHPSSDDVMGALATIYPAEKFSVEHRAMLIDGSTHIVFEVYDRARRPPGTL